MEFKQDDPRKSNIKKSSEVWPAEQKNTVPKNQSKAETEPLAPLNNPALSGKNLFEGGANDLVKGIILAEVLGKPLSRRNRR